MPISASQGQALVALLHQLRHDWGTSGIAAAIRKAADLGSPAEIAVAACRCAADPDHRTPALIPEPGPHWQGTAAGKRLAPTMCAEHPAQKAGHCPECYAARKPRPATCVVPPRTRPRDWTPLRPMTDLEATRARADEGETL